MYTIRSLIPFDLLVDMDMGLIKYTQIAFKDDPRLFYPELLKMIGPEHTPTLQYALVHRKFLNPLSAIVRQEKLITCKPDKMVSDILESSKKNVLRLSTTTGIMDMVCRCFFVSDMVQFDVLCNDEVEKEELLYRFKKRFNTDKIPANIIVNSKERISLANYGAIYLKDVYDISKYRHPIEGKNIIIAKYDFNLEYDIEKGECLDLPKMDAINEYTSCNEIKFIDIYAGVDSNGEG